jgi:hypothetical protein
MTPEEKERMNTRKDLHLHFPESLWKGVKKYAEVTGMSYTNVIYNCVFFFLFTRNLIEVERPTVKVEKGRIIEELKYCDTSS